MSASGPKGRNCWRCRGRRLRHFLCVHLLRHAWHFGHAYPSINSEWFARTGFVLWRPRFGGSWLTVAFFTAIAAAATFYISSRRFAWLVRHAFVSGAIFGLCIYAVMNFIVVPLSAFPHKLTFPPIVLATGLFVRMFLVGIPIALFIRAASLRETSKAHP